MEILMLFTISSYLLHDTCRFFPTMIYGIILLFLRHLIFGYIIYKAESHEVRI